MITLDDLQRAGSGYTYHHTASRQGYVSRKISNKVVEYKGRFGSGYAVLFPRWDTSKYIYIAYYVKKRMVQSDEL